MERPSVASTFQFIEGGRSFMVVNGRYYSIGEKIGEGGWGSVYEVKDEFGEDLVMKWMKDELKNVEGEARLLRQINRSKKAVDYFPEFVDFVKLPGEKSFCVIMSKAKGETLDKIIERGRLRDATKVAIIKALWNAVRAAHQVGVAHRDLKPENILIEIGFFGGFNSLTIIDWGNGQEGVDLRSTDQCCTYGYASPQMHAGEGYNLAANDAWSVGVIAYEVMTGMLPFPEVANDFVPGWRPSQSAINDLIKSKRMPWGPTHFALLTMVVDESRRRRNFPVAVKVLA